MNQSVRSVCVCLAFLSAVTMAGATTYYVDGTTGNNGWAGTSWATARKTISSGDSNLTAGDTLLVRGDNIYTDGDVACPQSGTPGAPIIYKGVPGTNEGRLPLMHRSTHVDESGMTNWPGGTKTYITPTTFYYTMNGLWASPSNATLYDHDQWVRYTRITTGPADVEATPGSYYHQYASGIGSNIFIHTHDSSHPTNFNILYATGNRAFWPIGAGKDYIHYTGFIMKFHREHGIRTWQGSSNCKIYGNEFRDEPGRGIYVSYGFDHEIYSNLFAYVASNSAVQGITIQGTSSNTVIHGNTFYSGSTAISSAGVSNSTVYNNTIYSNTADGIYLSGSDSQSIYNNTIFACGAQGIELANAPNARIYGNTCYDNGDAGIRLSGSDDALIYNNTVYGDTDDGIEIYNSDRVTLFNNTVYNTGSGSGAIRLTNGGTDSKLFNNCISMNQEACIYVTASSTTGFEADYNNYHTNGTAIVGYWDGDEDSLADWQLASGSDANSLSVDPQFADTTTTPPDLHLQGSSPCRDSGTPSFSSVNAPSTDIDGDPRPQIAAYDMGSDEHVPEGTMFMIQ